MPCGSISLVFGPAATGFEHPGQDAQPISVVCRALSRFRRRLIASTGIWSTFGWKKLQAPGRKGKPSHTIRCLRDLIAYSAGAEAVPAGNTGAIRKCKETK
jgi:hypothetical protein